MPVTITGDSDVTEPAEKPGKDAQLLGAARSGDIKQAARLLDAGTNINAVGEDQYTPLHEAIHADRPEIAALLVRRGASLSAREKRGLNAFELARNYGRGAVIAQMKHALSLRNAARLKSVRRARNRPGPK